MPTPRLPADARRSLFVYRLCFPLVFLALLPGFLVRMWRRGGFQSRFGQRLGLFRSQDRLRLSSHRWLWVHSISVGETFIALKLARQLHAADPQAHILLSTTTTTAFALVEENASDWLEPLYNPADFGPIVRRTLDLLRPEAIYLIEGEAWPNLLAESFVRGIPVSLVEARLSPRSEARFRTFRLWTGPIFRLLEKVLVPATEDLERWHALGVPREKLHATGSLKFDHPSGTANVGPDLPALLSSAGVPADAPLIVAGSTHAGEERLLAEILPRLRAVQPKLRLVIVPRHAERAEAVLRDLASLGLRVVRRTELPLASPEPGCDVLLVDTTGELRHWYRLATAVFVGKSITAEGGQNPVEPALLGAPVFFGPHMENFRGVVPQLLAQRAAVQVPDIEALAVAWIELLRNPAPARAMAERARTVLAEHQGATSRAVTLLQQNA